MAFLNRSLSQLAGLTGKTGTVAVVVLLGGIVAGIGLSRVFSVWIAAAGVVVGMVLAAVLLNSIVWPLAWRRVAGRLGFARVDEGTSWRSRPELEGRIDGREVTAKLDTATQSRHKNTMRTIVETSVDGEDVDLVKIQSSDVRRGLTSGNPGASRATVGDEAFDDQFAVGAADEASARDVLSPDVRDEILDLDSVSYLAATDSRVSLTANELLLDPQKVRRHCELVVRVAERVNGNE